MKKFGCRKYARYFKVRLRKKRMRKKVEKESLWYFNQLGLDKWADGLGIFFSKPNGLRDDTLIERRPYFAFDPPETW